jgi:hypothetical protein
LWREGGFAGATEGVAQIPVVARAPLPGGAPRWFMRMMHMDVDEAVQAACDVGVG